MLQFVTSPLAISMIVTFVQLMEILQQENYCHHQHVQSFSYLNCFENWGCRLRLTCLDKNRNLRPIFLAVLASTAGPSFLPSFRGPDEGSSRPEAATLPSFPRHQVDLRLENFPYQTK